MIRSAIIIFLVNYGAFLFSQDLHYSRNFESPKKNLPVAILNNHESYFYVLRSNRAIHDFTIERRKKPSAEIVAFTPLKLDSVNATWFNYENLDYLLHEYDHRLYFIFVKVLNSKKELFLKTIDTNGKASGFKLLATIEKNNAEEDIGLEFKIVNQNKLLLVLSKSYLNGSVKKTIELFDLSTKEKSWQKKLPLENPITGYSQNFVCNAKGDLFYVLLKSELEYYKRVYKDHSQLQVPVYIYSSIDMVSYLHANSLLTKNTLTVTGINGIFNIHLHPTDSTLSLFLHFAKGEDPKTEKVFFISQQWNCDFSQLNYYQSSPLSEKIDKQLSYYDGTDYKTAADKQFYPLPSFYQHQGNYILSEHKADKYLKELLLVKWDDKSGTLVDQQLLPRKSNTSDEASSYRTLPKVSTIENGEVFHVIMLESRANSKAQISDYKHRSYKRLKTIFNANMVHYSLNKKGELSKEVIFQNDEFDALPLVYQSNQPEYILFLDGNKFEKFAILKLNPL